MLKSYKKLDRWYGPLEPEGARDTGASIPTPESADEDVPGADDGPARYPDYIAEAGSASARPDPAPAELSGRRTEFTGGWSDWVDAPDDDRDADLVRFPWVDTDGELAEPARIGRAPSRLRDAGADHGAHRRRTAGVLLAAVVLLGIATAVVLYLLAPGTPGAAAPGVAPGEGSGLRFTAGSTGADPTAAACPEERTAQVVRGAGPGTTNSGPEAILRFQYAYYVQRSGAEARAAVAPDAPVSAPEVIQAGIDSVAPGTEHCVQIVTVADGRYTVEVTEFRPGGEPATYSRQTVTTAVIDGRTLITGISAG
ncbi:hypothetical protein [Nocardia jinanensis]|uniref:DUF8176 domain-containing protein n=1 Tax=Nocardia jinanensis TaxID=382504 RepID=A0A917R7X0_9NOCA|nr:hypothetical protein [Nocardia jinanensis]GGK94270.1 hypothetical protein GCM10011588_05860 [Nocardia jinanensis]